MQRRTPTKVVDSLYRGFGVAPSAREETRDEGATNGTTLYGHFTPFDSWTEIHSWYEGDFLERIAPGSFAKTIKENRDQMVVQFDHGYDLHVSDAPLGPIDVLREEDFGPYYEVPLLDTDYNRNRILPLLQGRTMDGQMRGSLLGASFRFRVIKDEWDDEPGRSDSNPDGLPERTIKEVRLFEFGPVVFPAYPEATAKVRSLTDHYLDRAKEARSGRQPEPPLPQPPTAEPAPDHSDPPIRSGLLLASALTDLEKIR